MTNHIIPLAAALPRYIIPAAAMPLYYLLSSTYRGRRSHKACSSHMINIKWIEHDIYEIITGCKKYVVNLDAMGCALASVLYAPTPRLSLRPSPSAL
jgi:hypothetical protein